MVSNGNTALQDTTPYGSRLTLFSELFADVVLSKSEYVAVSSGGMDRSYRELSRDSDLLAFQMRASGIRQGSIIALGIARSYETIVSLVAAVKVGAVFVPIDPNYPIARQEYMIDDCKPELIIASPGTYFSAHENVPTLFPRCNDCDSGTNEHRLDTQCYPTISPTDPAYIIYTSGSTGRPKGAINTQQALGNLALAFADGFAVEPGSRVLQFASLSFDASIAEIAPTLAVGATLVLAPQDKMIPGPSLIEVLRKERITHVILPPTVLAVIPHCDLPDLRVIMVAGEKCPLDLARVWSKGRSFLNGYGVSEAAVCSAIHAFSESDQAFPIGEAIAGVQLVALAENGREASHGECGELLIGGVGVGIGYLNRPELTQQKFIQRGGAHFYRSGDIVRKLADGHYDFVGRIDNQVKVRGYRIELDEVAKMIEEHSNVKQCIVLLREDQSGSKHLDAYFMCQSCPEPQPIRALVDTVKQFARQRLPAYMLPSRFIAVQSFPLSQAGKIDVKVLQQMHPTAAPILNPEIGPSVGIRSDFLLLLKELLETSGINLEQSFLDNGGDSLLAAELAWRLLENNQLQVSEAEILRSHSLEQLIQLLEALAPVQTVELLPLPRNKTFFPTPPQEIYCLLDHFGVEMSVLNVCAAFELEGALDHELFAESYRAMFLRHEGLRLRFPKIGERYSLWVHEDVQAELTFVDLRHTPAAEDKLQEIYGQAEREEFDLKNQLLVRSYLVALSDTKSIFVFIAHHAICDAWSLYVLLQDMCAYMAERKTGERCLRPIGIQFLDYSDWLERTRQRIDKTSYYSYLNKVLGEPFPLLDLRGAAPRPAKKSHLGSNTFCLFSKDETRAIMQLAAINSATGFMACTAALVAAVLDNATQPEIIFGGPVSIRSHRELEHQVGLYSSSFIARVTHNPTSTFAHYLASLRNTLIDAYQHQVFSIVEVLDRLQIAPDYSRTLPFDLSIGSHMFELQFCRPEIAALLGLRIKPLRYPLRTSFFDLEFTVHLFEGQIDLETRFDSAIYGTQHIERIVNQSRALLLNATRNPEVAIAHALAS